MSKELDKRIKIDVKKLRMETYIARLIEVVEKNQRPRPDGSIDWNKAIPKLEELQNYILDEQKKEIVERMKDYVVNAPLGVKLSKIPYDIINLITKD